MPLLIHCFIYYSLLPAEGLLERHGSPGARFIGDPVKPLVERSRYRGGKKSQIRV